MVLLGDTDLPVNNGRSSGALLLSPAAIECQNESQGFPVSHSDDFLLARASSDLQEKPRAQGLDAIGGTSEQFQTYLKRESAKWADVVRATGARVEFKASRGASV